MRKQVGLWVSGLKPPGEQVNGEREAVHLGEQSDDERRVKWTRQSPFVDGLKKLKANMMKTRELMTTSPHKPYPLGAGIMGASWFRPVDTVPV